MTRLPGLAALYDQMTDHRIALRPTAQEALSFLNNITLGLPGATLDAQVTVNMTCEAGYDTRVYWLKLAPEEYRRWQQYKISPRPMHEQILDLIARYPIGWRILRFIRRALHV